MISISPLGNIFLKFLNNYDLEDEDKPDKIYRDLKLLEFYTLGLAGCPHGKSACSLNEDKTCPTWESDATAHLIQITMK